MNEYLRPSTLFGNKFESYLNSTPKRKGPSSPYVEEATDWSKVKSKDLSPNQQVDLQKRLKALRKKDEDRQQS